MGWCFAAGRQHRPTFAGSESEQAGDQLCRERAVTDPTGWEWPSGDGAGRDAPGQASTDSVSMAVWPVPTLILRGCAFSDTGILSVSTPSS